MLQKKDYVAGTIIVYIFSVMLFLLLQQKSTVRTPCDMDQPCVRFCCEDKGLCKEKNIRESFNASLLDYYGIDENVTREFVILHGKPKCSMITIPENSSTQWHFSYVSSLTIQIRKNLLKYFFISCQFGNIWIDDEIYVDLENYCFQESKVNKLLTWNLMTCKSNYYLQFKLHIFCK